MAYIDELKLLLTDNGYKIEFFPVSIADPRSAKKQIEQG